LRAIYKVKNTKKVKKRVWERKQKRTPKGGRLSSREKKEGDKKKKNQGIPGSLACHSLL